MRSLIAHIPAEKQKITENRMDKPPERAVYCKWRLSDKNQNKNSARRSKISSLLLPGAPARIFLMR